MNWNKIFRLQKKPSGTLLVCDGKKFEVLGNGDNAPWATHYIRLEDLPAPKVEDEGWVKPQWISVKDRLPEYGVKVAVLYKSKDEPEKDFQYAVTSYCCNKDWGFNYSVAYYWYSLPEIPK